jgi:hypothetical protein
MKKWNLIMTALVIGLSLTAASDANAARVHSRDSVSRAKVAGIFSWAQTYRNNNSCYIYGKKSALPVVKPESTEDLLTAVAEAAANSCAGELTGQRGDEFRFNCCAWGALDKYREAHRGASGAVGEMPGLTTTR